MPRDANVGALTYLLRIFVIGKSSSASPPWKGKERKSMEGGYGRTRTADQNEGRIERHGGWCRYKGRKMIHLEKDF
jgi:hypothetical protein